MKKAMFVSITFLVCGFSMAQTPFKKELLNEVCDVLQFQMTYNPYMKGYYNQFCGKEGIARSYGSLKIENMRKNAEDRNFVFKFLHWVYPNEESFTNILIAWDMKPSTAIYTAGYVRDLFYKKNRQ